MTERDDTWELDELAAKTAEVLSEAGVAQDSERVSTAPTPRTIRYYATHGLVDKPSEFDGRTALYGPTHLLQLLAIKRLQARGRTLDEIQQRLAGARDDELRELAGLDDSGDTPDVAAEAEEPRDDATREQARATERQLEEFWTAEAADERVEGGTDVAASSRESAGQPSRTESTGNASPDGALAGVQLDDAVRLVLDAPERELETRDVEAIRAAAAPLMKVLKNRGIID